MTTWTTKGTAIRSRSTAPGKNRATKGEMHVDKVRSRNIPWCVARKPRCQGSCSWAHSDVGGSAARGSSAIYTSAGPSDSSCRFTDRTATSSLDSPEYQAESPDDSGVAQVDVRGSRYRRLELCVKRGVTLSGQPQGDGSVNVEPEHRLGWLPRPLGLEIRAGLHTGEIELRGTDIAGIGVHIAARVLESRVARGTGGVRG